MSPAKPYIPFPYYGTFYGHYGALSPVIYTPGYMETEKEAQVEVKFLFDGEARWRTCVDRHNEHV
jgi:hypothetical protein